MLKTRLLCVLLIATVCCLSLPEIQAKTTCEAMARKNYENGLTDCGVFLGIGIASCHMSLLVPAAFLVCQSIVIGSAAYCIHRVEQQYRDTLEFCLQESA